MSRPHLRPRNRAITIEDLKSGSIEDFDGCWIWQRQMQSDGYGSTKVQGKKWRVHRLAWTLVNGPIPEGLTIDHVCFKAACCNPDHLRPLSNAENARRQRRRLSSTCARGHEFTTENTWVDRFGHRKCKSCQRARRAARRQVRGES